MRNLIWIASWPKSGNTWLRAFLLAYQCREQADFEVSRLCTVTSSESSWTLFEKASGKPRWALANRDVDKHREAAQHLLAWSGPPWFVKTHNCRVRYDQQKLIFEQFTKCAVYVIRNPLDIVDSLADHAGLPVQHMVNTLCNPRHRTGDRRQFVAQYPGAWCDHVQSWTNQSLFPVLIVRYEDLLYDAEVSFGQIVRFLGWDDDPNRIRAAVRTCSFANLRRLESRSGFNETNPRATSGRFFRYGEAGRWRKILSQRQAERIFRTNGAVMEQFGYGSHDFATASGHQEFSADGANQ